MTTPIQSINSQVELDAVNAILACIGEVAITSLIAVDDNADAANALRCLRSVNQTVQSKGWSWNIEDDTILQPDTFSKQINYIPDYLVVQASGGATPTIYRNRGGFVYDTTAKTDLFDGPITVRLIRLQPLDEMPVCFYDWIVAKASRTFNARFFGDSTIDTYLAGVEKEAYIQCNEYEMDYGAKNILSGDAFIGGQLSRS